MSTSTDFKPSVQTFSLATGGTSEILVEANSLRSSIIIQPQTEVSLVNFGATAGTQATGTLTVGSVPLAAVTIAINGVTFTFVAANPGAAEFLIGADKDETAANMASQLNASVNASISVATYSVSGAVVTITYDAGGVDGNAYTLANSSGAGAVTRSAATLTGGSDTIGNGISLASLTPYTFNAAEFPQIKEDIYIVSATGAAKTVYLEGIEGV